MNQENKYKTKTPEQIARKYLQVTEFEGDLTKDIEAYANSRIEDFIKSSSIKELTLLHYVVKEENEIQAVSINDNNENEMLNAIGKIK